MGTAMTSEEKRILDTAVAALTRTTGVSAGVLRTTTNRDRLAGAIVEIKMNGSQRHFRADIRTVDRFETPAIVKAQSRSPTLLIAPYITRKVAERCRQLHLPFLDTAGNAYLESSGLLVYVVGQPRPLELHHKRFCALNPAGLKLTFALLCRPELIHQNYRKIANDAGIALGTVSSNLKDLGRRGYFNLKTQPGKRKLLAPERMLEEWATHYPVTLRPKLYRGRFRADPKRLQQIDLIRQDSYWGGERAADKLTRYLKPELFTIYTGEPIAKLVAAGRMRAEENGNVEILEKFWRFNGAGGDNDMPDVVPAVLAYADLLATHDGRNAEAARMIYEQRIAPVFRTPK